MSFVALTLGLLLRFFKQPAIVAYILTGLIISPLWISLFKLFEKEVNLSYDQNSPLEKAG